MSEHEKIFERLMFLSAKSGEDEVQHDASETYWGQIDRIRSMGAELVWSFIVEKCLSPDAAARERAVDVLAQLKGRNEAKTTEILLGILQTETNDDVVASCLSGLGHQYYHQISFASEIGKFLNHPNRDVRFALALALPRAHDSTNASQLILTLMADSERDVRNWATFAFNNGLEGEDSPVIRDALFARVNDWDNDTRVEAIQALARRGDVRALPPLLHELDGGTLTPAIEDAAVLMLSGWSYGNPSDSTEYARVLRDKFRD